MDFPEYVYVGGHKVTISVDDEEDWGSYNDDTKCITLAVDGADEGELFAALRHEMIHAALGIGGLSHLERFEEEAVVRCVENLFFPAWEKVVEEYDL